MTLAQHLQNVLDFFLKHIGCIGVFLPVGLPDFSPVRLLIFCEVSMDEVQLVLGELATLPFVVELDALRLVVVSQIDEVKDPLVAAGRRVRSEVHLVVAVQLLDRDADAARALAEVVVAFAVLGLLERVGASAVALTNEAFADLVVQVGLLAPLR